MIMERSTLSNIISITRLASHFDENDRLQIMECIKKEFKFHDESEYTSKTLLHLYELNRAESAADSIVKIKDRAMEIAEQEIAITMPDGKTKTTTLHEYVQQSSYQDNLSLLNGDVINVIGSYLNKKQSIEFGYLNRQLYIETQKNSYLLERCKDDDDQIFELNDKTIQLLTTNQLKNSIFAYGIPLKLSLSCLVTKNNVEIFESKLFKRLFLRINYLKISNFSIIPFIPFDMLFIKNAKKHENFQMIINIDKMDDNDILESEQKVASVCDKFSSELANNNTYSTNINCNCITKLTVDNNVDNNIHGNGEQANGILNKLLYTFGNISKFIKINKIDIIINSIDSHLLKIFHKNLEKVELTRFATISVTNNDLLLFDKNRISNSPCPIMKVVVISDGFNYNNIFGKMELDYEKYYNIFQCCNFLKRFDTLAMFNITKNVTHVIAYDAVAIFESKFLQLLPSLNKIVVELMDNYQLEKLADILYKFVDFCNSTSFGACQTNIKYYEIIVTTKIDSNNISNRLSNTRDNEDDDDDDLNNIDIYQSQYFWNNNIYNQHKDAHAILEIYGQEYYQDIYHFFKQESNQIYDSDDDIIEIKKDDINSKYTIPQFGNIYRNIIDWHNKCTTIQQQIAQFKLLPQNKQKLFVFNCQKIIRLYV